MLKVHPSNFVVPGFTRAVRRRRADRARRAGRRRHRLRAARAAPAAARRARRRRPRSPGAPPWSPRPGTSCSAARRPGCCSAGPGRAPSWWRGSAGIRWPGRCGWTSSRWPRWRRPCAGRGRPSAGRAGRRAGAGCAARAARLAARLLRRPGSPPPRHRARHRGRRRRAGRRAAQRGGRAARALRGGAAGAASPRCSAALEHGRCLLDLRAIAPDDDDALAAAVLAAALHVRVHVVATAGHVDHGKSTLVRALTGMEPDRLGRGAPPRHDDRPRVRLDRRCRPAPVAFVDVPGHERFVTTMLAGVGPGAGGAARRRGGRGLDAAVGRARRRAGGARRAARAAGRDPQRPAGARSWRRRRGARAARRHPAGRDCRPSRSPRSPAPGLDELRAALADAGRGGCPPPTRPPTCGSGWTARSPIRGAGTVVTGTLGGRPDRGRTTSWSCRRGRRPPPGHGARAAEPRRPTYDGARGGPGGGEPARRAAGRRSPAATRCSRRAPGSRRRRPSTSGCTVRPEPAPMPTHLPGELTLHVGAAAVAGPGATARAATPCGCGWAARCRCASATARCCAIPAGRVVAAGRDRARRRAAGAAPPRGAAARRAAELADHDRRPGRGGGAGAAAGSVRRSRPAWRWACRPPARRGRARARRPRWLAGSTRSAARWAGRCGLAGGRARRRRPARPRPAAWRPPAGPRACPTRGWSSRCCGRAERTELRRARAAGCVAVARRGAAGRGCGGAGHAARRPGARPRSPRRTPPGSPSWASGPRQLASLVRAGELLRDRGRRGAAARRRRAGARACWPALGPEFTLSAARQALGTSRRVAVPLLELLARTGRTGRTPDGRHELVGE